MRASRAQRSKAVIAEPFHIEPGDETFEGVAKTRFHKRSGQKRSPAKVRAKPRVGTKQNPSAAKRSKKTKTTRPRYA